jgi:hypothetical protein
VSQSERTGVPTPDSADLSAGGHKIARRGSRCSRDNQADGEGSPTDTDTRATLSILTPEEGEKGGVDHWETRMWESCDISVCGTTRELGFPVTRNGVTVKSVRDTAEGGGLTLPSLRRFCASADKHLGRGSQGLNLHSV